MSAEIRPLQTPDPAGDPVAEYARIDGIPAVDAAPAPPGLDPVDTLAVLLHRNIPMTRIVELYDEVDSTIARAEAKLIPHRDIRRKLLSILDARMRDAKQTKLAAPGFRISMKTIEGVEKRIDVLRELVDLKDADGNPLIPPEELNKAIRLEPQEPKWWTHKTFLEKLAAYGEKVQDVLARGIVKTSGAPQLVIERIEPEPRNVTGSTDGADASR